MPRGGGFLEGLEALATLAAAAEDAWGRDAQARMVSEEAGELIVETNRYMRGRATAEDVLDEAADGILVSVEAAVLAGCTMEVLEARLLFKAARLQDRLNAALPVQRQGAAG